MDLESEVIVPQILGIYTAQQHRAGNQIMREADLSYLRNTDCREKYYDFSNINSQVCENIRKDTTLIAKALGIKGFSRFDIRIDDSYQPFFIEGLSIKIQCFYTEIVPEINLIKNDNISPVFLTGLVHFC